MDTSDIYYSDNSQLVDENNSEWIENTVLIENQGITWQEDGPEITVDYSETANDINKTLTESDSYLTANNDESATDPSQYYSILESNCDDTDEYSTPDPDRPNCFVNVAVGKDESILPHVAKREIIDDEEYADPEINAENVDDQVILYRMEGSDELYAVQLADDGNGNLQKYKYRVRQNDDGQFEAIPGSIEIEKADGSDLLFAPTNPDEDDPEADPEADLESEVDPEPELEDSQPKDQKPSPETLAFINQQISENIEAPEIDNNFYSVHNFVQDLNPDDYLLQNSYQESEEEYQTVDGVHVTADEEIERDEEVEEHEEIEGHEENEAHEEHEEHEENEEREENEEHEEIERNDENLHAEETEFVNANNYPEEEEEEDEDFSESEYEVEELDDAFQDENINDQILQKSNIDNTKINPELDRNVTIYRDDKNLSYLVIKAKEKENVIIRTNNFNSPNLRSILKSSFSNKLKTSTPKPEKEKPNLPAIISKANKEPVPVNNTVLKPRQPRKQTIKPVERADSEIIVQPLIYALNDSSSFIVPMKRKRVFEEILQVSDESDPEFTMKPKKKKKKKKHGKRGRPKNVEITILDSDDDEENDDEEIDDDEQSDVSVIEVTDQEDASDNENNNKDNNPEEEVQIIEESNSNNKTEEESTIPDTKLTGRPRKSLDLNYQKEEESTTPEKKLAGRPRKSLDVNNQTEEESTILEKKLAGRPRKSLDLNNQTEESTIPEKKLASRPRKNLDVNNQMEEESTMPEKKLAGRPQKSLEVNNQKEEESTMAEKKLAGRPRRSLDVNNQTEEESTMPEKKLAGSPRKSLDLSNQAEEESTIPVKKLAGRPRKSLDPNNQTEESMIPEKKLVGRPRKSLDLRKNKCPHCPKTFPRLINLKIHMNIHNTRRSLRSRPTNSELANSEHKEEQLEQTDVAPKSRQFNCQKCKLKFLTEGQFKRHQTIHFAKNKIKKPVTPLRKPDKQILISQKHLRSNSKTESKLTQRLDSKTKESFKCEYCGQHFGTKTLLIVHRNSHKTFPCPNCKTTFTAKLLLDDHLRKNCVKGSIKKKFTPKRINSKCDVCNQVFPTPKSLQIHKNITHRLPRVASKRITIETIKLPVETKKLPVLKTKGAHGGVPPSLKMQLALNKLNKMKP